MTGSSLQIRGSLDGVLGRVAFGWAFCPSLPHQKLRVEIVEASSGRILADGLANQPREDLSRMEFGDGRYAFRIALPFSPVHSDHLQARVEGVLLPASRGVQASILPRDQLDVVLRDQEDSLKIHTAIAKADISLHRILRLERQLQEQARTLHQHDLVLRLSNSASRSTPVNSETLSKAADQGALIILSIIDWDFRFQRPQQLSLSLSKRGHRVFYINPTFLPVEARNPGEALRPRFRDIDLALTEVCLTVPALLGSDHSHVIYERPSHGLSLWLAAQIRQVCHEACLVSPTIVVMHPSWHAVCRQGLREFPLIYDCMDYIAGFPETSSAVLEEESRLIQDCDCAVVASQFLYEHVTASRRVLVRNACDYKYFSSALHSEGASAQLPTDSRDFAHVVGYYGAISTWFDLELVVAVAERLPDHLFILAGSTEGCDTSRASHSSNIFFLGELPYEDLVPFLRRCDICIIPFKINDLIRATNPVKIYEYLAAGKPVVATPLPELKAIGLSSNFCTLAEDAVSFVNAISALCQTNTQELALQRSHYASGHTWEARADTYEQTLASLLPSVTIVIICYNQVALTRRCVESILSYTNYPRYELILVDNGSTDGTYAYASQLESEHDHIRFLPLGENLGFPVACNRGIRSSDKDAVVLMNNDTHVTPGWLFKLIRPSLRDSSIGLCGPLTNNIGNQQKIHVNYSTMVEMVVRSEIFMAPRCRQLYEAEGLAFFCVLLTRRVIDAVGLLDEGYGLGFFEDDDYCMRVAEAGYRIVICDDVFVHHELGGSFGRLSPLRQQLMRDNERRFLHKWGRLISHRYREEPGFG
ncbi:glycosyltransferase [Vulcanococcus limneticus]|uniref:glycosyltransferase n=1 Tax=Vulcanococcus limneticus TaxID=2170428 RepID=UPI0020CCD3DE|nr:glycosyltransferase [Vulcanococcus limneticus]